MSPNHLSLATFVCLDAALISSEIRGWQIFFTPPLAPARPPKAKANGAAPALIKKALLGIFRIGDITRGCLARPNDRRNQGCDDFRAIASISTLIPSPKTLSTVVRAGSIPEKNPR